MNSLPPQLRYLVAVGTAALLVGGCSKSETPSDSTKQASTAPTSTSSTAEPPEQRYLDSVNGLCDKLLPKVIRITQGGSTDIPVRQYLKDWPAHRRVLAAFDRSLAQVPVPSAAAPVAAAMGKYVKFADHLDAARLKAARHGERAWRHEVTAEADVENDPSIAALTSAGFADSCQAR